MNPDGWAFGILAAAFLVPWAARRWNRRVERNATRHQVELRHSTRRDGSHVRVLGSHRPPVDWDKDEYGWPS